MKTILLLGFLVVCIDFAHGQNAASPYKFSYQLDSIYQKDSDESYVGTRYSWIGDYHRACEYFKIYSTHRWDDLSSVEVASFKNYHAVDAEKYILDRAKDAKIIIINEAHHVPMHRVFVESLLPALKKEGFDRLGMEAFDNDDTAIYARKYPVIKSGSYTKEPCYGNMIRKAIKEGYALFGYETTKTVDRNREMDQADNIEAEIKAHPNSRFIIYCGYDHFIKDTMPGDDSWRHAMAGWLKLRGIESLTIDQYPLTETGYDNLDNRYRKMIEADHDVVMIDDSGRSLKPKPRYNGDISVYHPDTKYIHGRPVWQIISDKRTENISKKIKIGYPCLVQVYRAGEDYDNAVPTDVVEIKSKDQDMHVILEKKHKNVIILRNPQGQKQVIEE